MRSFNASIIAEIDTAFAPLASDRPEDLGSAVHGMPAVQLSAVETPLSFPVIYRNHLQESAPLGAQIVVPIVLQGASGRWLSVLRQRHACGVSGHRSANAYLSAYPGTLLACLGCLPAAFGSSVLSRRHDGARLRVDSRKPDHSSAGTRTIHRRSTEARRGARNIDHWSKRNR